MPNRGLLTDGSKVAKALDGVGDKVSAAVEKVDPTAAATTIGTMGIRGALFQTLANTSAMVLLGAVMWVQFRENAAQSKYDREMFREEIKATRVAQSDDLKALRTSQELRWEKTDAAHSKAMERMGQTVERSVAALEKSVDEQKATTKVLEKAIDEIKKTNEAIRPVGGARPPG